MQDNIFHHKQSYIIVDIDKNAIEFLLNNEHKYKTINIILNNINDEIYRNILLILDKLDKRIVLTSLSVLTDKFAKKICDKYSKIYLNRNDKLVLTNGNKNIVFEDTLMGIKMIEIKQNSKNQRIFKRESIIKKC